jgi:hypothetical protein
MIFALTLTSEERSMYNESVFRLVFIGIVMLTVLSLLTSIMLAYTVMPTSLQNYLFELCAWTWKIGFVSICALAGMKWL